MRRRARWQAEAARPRGSWAWRASARRWSGWRWGCTRPAPALDAPAEGTLFKREGEYWTVAHDGVVLRLRDSLGLQYLARLLRNPGREVLAVDLAVDAGAGPRGVAGPAGVMLDRPAKAAYRRRLGELREELQEARANSDGERRARIETEMHFLARELARAVGLGGRDRRAGSHAERARVNVTHRLRAAVEKIAAIHPSLGSHLGACIKTGLFCSYAPDPGRPVTWEL